MKSEWYPDGCCKNLDYCLNDAIYQCNSEVKNKYCPYFDLCSQGQDKAYDGTTCPGKCGPGIEKDDNGNCCDGQKLTPEWYPYGCCKSWDYCSNGEVYQCTLDENNKYCLEFDRCERGEFYDFEGVPCPNSCAKGADRDDLTGECCN